MLWCCAIAGFAVSSFYPLALALLFVAGFLELSFNSMAQALIQIHAPQAIRGRVIGLYSMAGLGLRAFSGITVGILGGFIGIHWSLSLSALTLVQLLRKPTQPSGVRPSRGLDAARKLGGKFV